MRLHKTQFRVYYEDTDTGGVVYYAHYFRFAERGRTEFLRTLGVNQNQLWEKLGIRFVVATCEAKFFKPAKLDDLLEITTHLMKKGKVSWVFDQKIHRDGDLLTQITTKIACVDEWGRARKIPEFMYVNQLN